MWSIALLDHQTLLKVLLQVTAEELWSSFGLLAELDHMWFIALNNHCSNVELNLKLLSFQFKGLLERLLILDLIPAWATKLLSWLLKRFCSFPCKAIQPMSYCTRMWKQVILRCTICKYCQRTHIFYILCLLS